MQERKGRMGNVDALFGIEATSSSSAQGMRLSTTATVYSVNDNITPPLPGSSPPPHHHHMNGAAQTNDYQQQQQPPTTMMMMMMMKKRGRPRKHSGGSGGGVEGNMSLALMPSHTAPPPLVTQPAIPVSTSSQTATPTTTTTGGGGEFSPASAEGHQPMFKKARGRPPGSTNKIQKNIHHHQLQPLPLLGSSGVGFTPHVISVKAGEDVSSKIMSFSQNGPRAVCILSANGSISSVTLRQAATSGGTATYEGRFEILSLCGSFLLTEVAGQRSRTGGLSVSLAGPDGRVLGGCVAGLLTAASPIQVIVGSFIPDGKELMKTVNHTVESTHNFSSLPMPMPMPMPMSMSMSMPPVLFSAGGGTYSAAPPTTGVNNGSPPSQVGGGGSFDDESSSQEEEEEEGGSPPDLGTGGTAVINNHHHISNGNPHAMLGMPWR